MIDYSLIAKTAHFLARNPDDGLFILLYPQKPLFDKLESSLISCQKEEGNLAGAYDFLIRYQAFEKIQQYAKIFFAKQLCS